MYNSDIVRLLIAHENIDINIKNISIHKHL